MTQPAHLLDPVPSRHEFGDLQAPTSRAPGKGPANRLARAARTLCAAACLLAGAQAGAAVLVTPKFILHGAGLAAGTAPMRTSLRALPAFPTTDPYGLNVTAATSPATTVDWVKVELLSGPSVASCSAVFTTAGFLLSDGTVVGADGNTLSFPTAPAGTYNIRIGHRNHASLNVATSLLNVYNNADGNLNGNVRYGGLQSDEAYLTSAVGGNINISIPIPDAFPTGATAAPGATCGNAVLPAAATPVPIPALSPVLLTLLAGLMAAAGSFLSRRR